MALSKIFGYDILLTLGGSKIAGTTSDAFTLAGVNEESVMKSDNGVPQIDVLGHEGTFTVNAFVMKGTTAGWLNVVDVMDACTDNDDAEFDLSFGGNTAGNCRVTGTAKFMSFSVNSDSESYSDMSVELQTVGAVTVTNY